MRGHHEFFTRMLGRRDHHRLVADITGHGPTRTRSFEEIPFPGPIQSKPHGLEVRLVSSGW